MEYDSNDMSGLIFKNINIICISYDDKKTTPIR